MRAPLYSSLDDELLSPTAIDNPVALYSRLLKDMPLSRIAESGMHIIANWALIQEVLQRENDFSANLTGVLYRDEAGKPASFEFPEGGATNVIATADDPAHAIHRQLLQARFTPTSIASMEAPVREWTVQALAPLLAARGGDIAPACELVPALVVARLLGLPESDVAKFRVWAMMGGDMLAGEVSIDTMLFLADETGKMAAYLGEHFDAAFADTDSDAKAPLLHVLAQGVHDGLIVREEAIGIAIVLFGAGGESTAALIASCIKMLAGKPRLADQLRSEPTLITRFVEEVVRLEPPFKFHYRSVQGPCELGGYAMDKGDRLLLLWAAANRDPAMIADPDELRLDRKHTKQHMGFGHGLHFCIGAVLARLEARVMVEQLLLSTQSITLAEDAAVYANSIFVRRLQYLGIVLH